MVESFVNGTQAFLERETGFLLAITAYADNNSVE